MVLIECQATTESILTVHDVHKYIMYERTALTKPQDIHII